MPGMVGLVMSSVHDTTGSGDELLTVDFEDTQGFTAPASDLEHAEGAFRVGERVQVKGSVRAPEGGWGAVTHGMVGTVRMWGVDPDHPYAFRALFVDFEEWPGWPAMASEIEKADVSSALQALWDETHPRPPGRFSPC